MTPQNSTNESGEQRRIGFELEFGELELDAAAIVAEVFSGSIEKRTEMEIKVKCEKYDAFTVELDWQLGKRIAEKRAGKSLPSREGDPDAVMDWLKWLAGQLVPVEIVCPPLCLSNLNQLDVLVDRLREAGAKGTDKSYVYAFGVHINPAIAFDDDNIIQAVEAVDGTSVFGVQWHPEYLFFLPRQLRLFRWLVEQADRH